MNEYNDNSDPMLSDILSYSKGNYESTEMKQLISLIEPEEQIPIGLHDVSYNQKNVFPEWVLKNTNWKGISSLDYISYIT